MSMDDDDDWIDIYDDPKVQGIQVPPESVLLRTKDSLRNGKFIYHKINILIGHKVFEELGWNETTNLKFQWSKTKNPGLVRIAVILNDALGGWKPKVFKVGYSGIQNKALPKDVNKINRMDVELTHSIGKDPRAENLFYLELKLPEDFYLNNIQETTSPVEKTEVVQNKPAELVLNKEAFLKSNSLSVESKPKIQDPPKITKLPETPKKAVPPESSPQPLTPYERAVNSGGPISIDDLCKFIRVVGGDQASVISSSQVEINSELWSHTKALNYANELRRKSSKSIFSLK